MSKIISEIKDNEHKVGIPTSFNINDSNKKDPLLTNN